jgi:hypothetical protein
LNKQRQAAHSGFFVKHGDYMEYVDILDAAMYKGAKLKVTTKERGVIVGTPTMLDDFISDDDRLGYCLRIAPHLEDTVYLDEITAVEKVA